MASAEENAPEEEAAPEECLPDVLDAKGVLAHKNRFEMFQRAEQGLDKDDV